MEDNTNQVETPQESTSQPRDEQGRFTPQVDPIVDEVIFGSKDPDELLNPTTEGQTDTREGEPVEMKADPSAQSSTTPNNDEVRYQYWQSEADKRGNELDGMKQTNEMLQKQVNTLIERGAAPGQGQPAQAEETFEFPDPPGRPQKPHGFNRAEAYEDPSSESARYLDTIEGWRDDMDEYNRLRGEYDRELLAAERQSFTDEQNRQKEAYQQQAQHNEQITTIRSQVAQKFNADEATIDDFMETMSKPESLTVENLWKLYSLQKSESGNAVPQSSQNVQPSAAFEQTRRAQQIPSPMGVVTGVNQGSDGRAPEDKMMDSMIADYKGKNPF
jgi:hypothetical protein